MIYYISKIANGTKCNNWVSQYFTQKISKFIFRLYQQFIATICVFSMNFSIFFLEWWTRSMWTKKLQSIWVSPRQAFAQGRCGCIIYEYMYFWMCGWIVQKLECVVDARRSKGDGAVDNPMGSSTNLRKDPLANHHSQGVADNKGVNFRRGAIILAPRFNIRFFLYQTRHLLVENHIILYITLTPILILYE